MKKIRTIDDIIEADWEDIKWRREQGANLDQVGELYGITGGALQKRAGGRGINIGPSRYDRLNAMLDPDWPGWDDVKQMHKQGRKWTEIAKHIGVTTATLRRMMVHLALRAPTGDAHKYYDGASPYEKTLYSQTLCWSCANAVPDKSGKRGCAWSRSFKPVKGWDADETRLYSDKPTQSYHVRQCPEFVRG